MTETPISDEALEAIRKGLEGVPAGPWAYRPKEYDDWGCVRGPAGDDGFSSFVFHARSGYQSEAELGEHRRQHTDPWGAIAKHIARLDPATVRSLLARIDAGEKLLALLQADLKRASEDAEVAACESCGASLFDGDDFVSDPDGIAGCWAAMTDLPSKRERPCFAYRVGQKCANTPPIPKSSP